MGRQRGRGRRSHLSGLYRSAGGVGALPGAGNFAAWLFTIARRKAIAAYRRRRPNLPLDEAVAEPAEDLLEQVVQGEVLERMAELFAGLGEDQRDLLRLRFTARLSYAEIGALRGSSEAAVKMAVYRLLCQMHEEWEKK
jgi:RNA polymerase sigma factor (sigma-70 family)